MSIMNILYREKECSRIEIAEFIGFGTNALGRPINKLIALDLIERNIDVNNRRYIKLSLTKLGVKIVEQYRSQMKHAWDIACKNFSSKQLTTITDTLATMNNQLKQHRNKK